MNALSSNELRAFVILNCNRDFVIELAVLVAFHLEGVLGELIEVGHIWVDHKFGSLVAFVSN